MSVSRYKQRFAELNKAQKRAFIPFTLLGWPDKTRCLQTIKCMIESGVTALELGIAFSDPVADGPVIAKAAFETLESGFKVADAFALLREARKLDDKIPIGILVYYNVILAYGLERFFKAAKESGVDGVLVADLPVESSSEVVPHAQANDVDLIFIVSPVTPFERLDQIVTVCGGFVYFVSRLGVTGTDRIASGLSELRDLVEELKKRTDLPVCAGFGVSNPNNANMLFGIGMDGVIVGSKVVETIRDNDNFAADLKTFFAEMLDACSRGVDVPSASG
jgi:tryptophan synthase alpha chain